MTQEEAKELWPIICAYSEGKTVEYFKDGEWIELKDPEFYGIGKYRIKPEPTYRPFKNADECWEEMKKHEPFGWVKIKSSGYYMCISAVYDECICFGSNNQYYHKNTLDKYTFIDGTPFGIKED